MADAVDVGASWSEKVGAAPSLLARGGSSRRRKGSGRVKSNGALFDMDAVFRGPVGGSSNSNGTLSIISHESSARSLNAMEMDEQADIRARVMKVRKSMLSRTSCLFIF